MVIDGTDGAGKATQTKLLIRRLKKAGKKVAVFDFPQYGKKSAGAVEDYLNGKYGTALELGPYIPSIFFAVDRFAAKGKLLEFLKKGYIVVSNRYVTANMGHQGGKIRSVVERKKYYKWLQDLEYNFFKIPKPDKTIILHVPPKIAQRLVDKKSKRQYLGKKKRDMHENDLGHLQAAERTYLEMARLFKYSVVKCWQKSSLLSPDAIAGLVWKQIQHKIEM